LLHFPVNVDFKFFEQIQDPFALIVRKGYFMLAFLPFLFSKVLNFEKTEYTDVLLSTVNPDGKGVPQGSFILGL
jgi:hypothetical protein